MDATFFHIKKGHWAGVRFGRAMLLPFGRELTPGRFDMLLALYGKPMRQSDIWKLMGVGSSAVSEMLAAMSKLGWVKAIRAADGRTRLISMTVRGLELFKRAYARCIRTGDATVEVNRALEGPMEKDDAQTERCKLVLLASKLVEYFGWTLEKAHDLYIWNPDDYRSQLDYPIGENAWWELRIADPGMIDAPMFEAGDVLAEIEPT